jgi:hypothetical protein
MTVLTESFEGGIWTQDSQGDWFRSSQRRLGTGTYSAEVDGPAQNATMTSSPIDLLGLTNATVSFSWFMERSANLGEYVALDVSTDGGVTWQERARLRANVDPENVWLSASVELTNIDSLLLRFRATIDRSHKDANVDALSVFAY